MGRFALRSEAKLEEFGLLYIPEGTTWHECDLEKNPYDDIPIKEGTYPIRISFFRHPGLRLCPTFLALL